MWRRLTVLICWASVLGAAHGAIAGLVGYWPLDEGTGGPGHRLVGVERERNIEIGGDNGVVADAETRMENDI